MICNLHTIKFIKLYNSLDFSIFTTLYNHLIPELCNHTPNKSVPISSHSPSLIPFWVHFCVWCEVGIQLHSFAFYPAVTPPFVEKAIFPHLIVLLRLLRCCLPFPLLSHKGTVEFSRGCMVCDIATHWMQKQMWESSCLLVSQALKIFTKM